jgi:thiol-disulfide isomerase/thioredoxin
MKKIGLLLFSIILFTHTYSQGYRIQIQYRPVSNGYLYLGYYFGDKKYLQDSAAIQPDGIVVFQGNQPLTGGLYLVIDEEKKRFADFLIDKEQTFQLQMNTADFTIQSITGSVDNKNLENYKSVTAYIFRNFQQWQQQLAQSKTKKDSTIIQNKINATVAEAQQWRDSFTLRQPDSYLALLFRLMKEPEYKINGKTKADSLNAWYEYKKQYWADISPGDDRLLRTPMFEQRLTRYFDNVVYRHPDSIKNEIDRFVLYSRTSNTMFRYYINRFTNEFMNPKYMGLDVVFLHLFEKYYLTNQVTWLEPKDKETVFNRAYSIMGNIVGEPASELVMLDTLDKKQTLYSLQAPYTLLVFWDPDCGHCKETVPEIDSLYRTAWKKSGVKVVGVLVDSVRSIKSNLPEVKKQWMQFIREKKLNGWDHWYQSFESREEEKRKSIPGFRQSYDVYQTPTIYLLDKDKRILAKKLTPEQVTDFLNFRGKN